MRLLGWLLFIVFNIIGLLYLTWAFQDADFSVVVNPSAPYISEDYKTKALVFLPVSILFCTTGVLFFICLRKK